MGVVTAERGTHVIGRHECITAILPPPLLLLPPSAAAAVRPESAEFDWTCNDGAPAYVRDTHARAVHRSSRSLAAAPETAPAGRDHL